MSSRLNEDRLRRQKYWHALPVGWEQLDYSAFLERRRELIATVIRDGFNTLWDTPQEPATANEITDLLAAGESQTVEFKSTARWNLKAGLQDKKIEHVIVKTVGGFLNAEGGVLVIGAADDGAIVGLEHDLATLNAKPDLDGFELWLRQHLDANLSVPTAALVRIAFEHVEGEDICLVHVGTAARPVFAKPVDGGKDPIDFWVRVGNLTRQLHGDDLVTYKDDHWG
jgi:predicted HTH transcriptional regulator